MPSIQVGVRVPPQLHDKLASHAEKADASKSEVILCALAQYLGCAEDVPLSQRVAKVEKRLAALEAEVRGTSIVD